VDSLRGQGTAGIDADGAGGRRDHPAAVVAQIAKSLVFAEASSGEAILVVASGENRVDLHKIERATGLRLGRADGRFVKARVGFAIGGIPPAGHDTALVTLLDPDLRDHEVVWAAAGTPFAVFAVDPCQLEAMTGGRWVELAEDRGLKDGGRRRAG